MKNTCPCFELPYRYDQFVSKKLGIDEADGRFGQVNLDTCKKCRQLWLHYFVEYEGFSKSGRWFRGPIASPVGVTAQSAADVLSKLEWYFCGGSFFKNERKQSGPCDFSIG